MIKTTGLLMQLVFYAYGKVLRRRMRSSRFEADAEQESRIKYLNYLILTCLFSGVFLFVENITLVLLEICEVSQPGYLVLCATLGSILPSFLSTVIFFPRSRPPRRQSVKTT